MVDIPITDCQKTNVSGRISLAHSFEGDITGVSLLSGGLYMLHNKSGPIDVWIVHSVNSRTVLIQRQSQRRLERRRMFLRILLSDQKNGHALLLIYNYEF